MDLPEEDRALIAPEMNVFAEDEGDIDDGGIPKRQMWIMILKK